MWIQSDGTISVVEVEKPLRKMNPATRAWLLRFSMSDTRNALDFVYDAEDRYLHIGNAAATITSTEIDVELPEEFYPNASSDTNLSLTDLIAQHLVELPAVWEFDAIRLWLGILDGLTKRRERVLARVWNVAQ